METADPDRLSGDELLNYFLSQELTNLGTVTDSTHIDSGAGAGGPDAMAQQAQSSFMDIKSEPVPDAGPGPAPMNLSTFVEGGVPGLNEDALKLLDASGAPSPTMGSPAPNSAFGDDFMGDPNSQFVGSSVPSRLPADVLSAPNTPLMPHQQPGGAARGDSFANLISLAHDHVQAPPGVFPAIPPPAAVAPLPMPVPPPPPVEPALDTPAEMDPIMAAKLTSVLQAEQGVKRERTAPMKPLADLMQSTGTASTAPKGRAKGGAKGGVSKKKAKADPAAAAEAKARRLANNRESAVISRQRKKVYIETLEKKVKTLHDEQQSLQSRASALEAANNILQNEVTRLRDYVASTPGGSSFLEQLTALTKSTGSLLPLSGNGGTGGALDASQVKASAGVTLFVMMFAFSIFFTSSNPDGNPPLPFDKPAGFSSPSSLSGGPPTPGSRPVIPSAGLPSSGRVLSSATDDGFVPRPEVNLMDRHGAEDNKMAPPVSENSPCGDGTVAADGASYVYCEDDDTIRRTDAEGEADHMNVVVPAAALSETVANTKNLPEDTMVELECHVVNAKVVPQQEQQAPAAAA